MLVSRISYLRSCASLQSGFARTRSASSGPAPQASEVSSEEWERAKPVSAIPGPSGWQLMRAFMPGGDLRGQPTSKMFHYLTDNFGPLVRMPGFLGNDDFVITFDPRHYESIFRTEGAWPFRRGIITFDYYRQSVRPELFAEGSGGLVSDQGEAWHNMRMAVNPVMLRPQTVRCYVPVVDEVAREFVQKIDGFRDANHAMPGDFSNELKLWAFESIGAIALDMRLGLLGMERDAETDNFLKAFEQFFQLSYYFEMMPPYWKYYKTKGFQELMDVYDVIMSTIQSNIRKALVQIEQGQRPGVAVSHEDSVLRKMLRTNPKYATILVFDMLFAGVATVHSTVSTLLYNLAINPELQEKLRAEVFQLLPQVDTPLQKESLNNAPYFRACLKESLRLNPIVIGNMRRTGQDLVLDGYRIPKGTDVAMSHMIPQTNEQFFPNAKAFVPERWLRDSAVAWKLAPDATPFAYLPFGSGPRACIGMRFAQLEIQVLTSRILRQFRIEWPNEPLQYEQGFVIAPSSPLTYRMVPL